MNLETTRNSVKSATELQLMKTHANRRGKKITTSKSRKHHQFDNTRATNTHNVNKYIKRAANNTFILQGGCHPSLKSNPG